MKYTPLGALWFSTLCVATFSDVQAGDSLPFHRFDAKSIRANIIGKVLTDGTHWSDYYRKDGVVESMSMGKEESGKWLISGDTLCVTSKSDNDCYEVWVSGHQVELRLEGTGYPYQAVIKEYSGK